MSPLRKCLVACAGVLMLAVPGAFGAKFRVVSDLGAYQESFGISEGAPGIFYIGAGIPACVVSITTRGKLTTLACPGGNNTQITSPVVSAFNERFYSATWTSGNATANIFSVSAKAGSEQEYAPENLLTTTLTINLPDGTLAGVAFSASNSYLVTCDVLGNLKTIYEFPNSDFPTNNVTYAKDGNFYGVAEGQVGSNAYSYIYQVTPAGTFAKLYSFPYNCFGTYSRFYPVVEAADGNFYGVSPYCGSTGGGDFYKVTPSGQYTSLYNAFPDHGFTSGPQFLLQASDGNFYGATLGTTNNMAIFELTPAGQFTVIHKMRGGDGQCQCELVQGSDGVIYGVALTGGPTGGGSLFAVDLGLPKPAPQALSFSPQSGHSGERVRIWGRNLLGASVQFNGTASETVKNSGPNYVMAEVPAGATSGPITITTPGGTSTTFANFMISSAKDAASRHR